jgi:CRISPR/Cas system-associated protein Cas5 (RAMP superfamily)
VAIYGFMNFVVLPLSAYPYPLRFPLLTTATGLLVHMAGIGLPISLITRRAHPPAA